MARTVEDAAIVMQVIAGNDPSDNYSASLAVGDFRAQFGQDMRGMRIGVLRHHWEEDIKVNPELRQAVDVALDVLRDLGAHVEEVRVRSLHDYYAVRIMLTESEIFAGHRAHLREHASDYGDHFLGRTLAACLFSSADYIAAHFLRLSHGRDQTDQIR
jgi:aspartyl-tRNA(Asn)/glutamyl-tRNA(Gln) amidotransferase subunit A